MAKGVPKWQERENKRLKKLLGIKQKDLETAQRQASQASAQTGQTIHAVDILSGAYKPEQGGTTTTANTSAALGFRGDLGLTRIPPPTAVVQPGQFFRDVKEGKQVQDELINKIKKDDQFWNSDEFKNWATDMTIGGGHADRPQIVQAIGGTLKTPSMVEAIKQQLGITPKPTTQPPPPPESLKPVAPIVATRVTAYQDLLRSKGMSASGKPDLTKPVIQPRTAFIENPEGQALPFYAQESRQAEFDAMQASMQGKPFIAKAITWLSIQAGKLGDKMYSHFVTIGGQTEEELAYQETPGVGAATIQLVFSAGVATVDGISYMFQRMGAASQQDKVVQLQSEIQSMPYGEERTKKQQLLNGMLAFQQDLQKAADRWEADKKAVLSSWDTVEKAQAENRARAEQVGAGPAPRYYSPAQAEQIKVLNQQQRDIAKQDSLKYADLALRTYNLALSQGDTEAASKNFDLAIKQQRDSIEARRRSDPYDSFGAASWSQSPDRYDMFMENAAKLELQLGRPLSTPEVRRLKDYYTNVWTELGFQLVFDVTNLIPFIEPFVGALGDVVRKIPFVSKGLEAAGDAKKAFLSAPVINILTRDSVNSVASRVSRTMQDNFARMLGAYNTSDEFVNEIPMLTKALEAASGLNHEQQLEIFLKLRGSMKGAEVVDFNAFKQMLDMAELYGRGDPEVFGKMLGSWSVKFEEGIQASTEMNKTHLRNLLTPGTEVDEVALAAQAEAMAQDPKQLGVALEYFGDYMTRVYKDARRIYKGGMLMEDTVAGTIQKYARMFAADSIKQLEENPEWLLPTHIMLKDASFEERMANWIANGVTYAGTKSPKIVKKVVSLLLSDGLEGFAKVGRTIRDFWSMMVLSTPRWVVTNMIDSTGRSMVYGGNPFDDIFTLMSSTQSHFIDDIGFAPMEFGQALANTNLPFNERIPVRLLSGDFKPKGGPFQLASFWADEWKRLRAERKGLGAAFLEGSALDTEISRNLAAKMAREQGSRFQSIWNGLATIPGAYAGGISNYNTAIEFTLRTRMFHREYFGLLSKLEPEFATKGMEALSPEVQRIANQIWKASGGSPAKLSALADSVLRGLKPTDRAAWSLMLPDNWDEILKGLHPADAANITYHVRSQLNLFMESMLKAEGRLPNESEIRAFTQSMREEFQQVALINMAGAKTYSEAGGVIDATKVGTPAPNVMDLKGSAPKVGPQLNEKVVAAAKDIKPRMYGKTLVEKYTVAMEPYGQVKRVAGDVVRVTVDKDQQLAIEIGEDLLKKKSDKVYAALKDATIDVMAKRDEKFITSQKIFTSLDDYKERVDLFITNPTELLNKRRDQFYFIFHQMNTNPQLKDVMEGMNKGFRARAKSAMDTFMHSEHMDVSMEKMLDWHFNEEVWQKIKDDVVARHPAVKEAIPAYNMTSHQFFEDAKALNDPEMFAYVQQYADLNGHMRTTWTTFLQEFGPSPKIMKRGAERSAAWEKRALAIADMYNRESEFRAEVMALMKTDKEKAVQMLKDEITKGPENFLQRMGVQIRKDELGNIMEMKMFGVRYSARTEYSPITAMQARFYNRPLATLANYPGEAAGTAIGGPYTRLGQLPQGALLAHDRASLTFAIKNTFTGMTQEQAEATARILENHANWYSKYSGQTAEDYFAKMSFAKAEGIYQLNDKDIFIKQGAIRFIPDQDRFVMFGLNDADFPTAMREASAIFYSDLATVAEQNTEMADVLKRIQSHIQNVSGEPFVGTQMTKKQAAAFSDLFVNYMQTGEMDFLRMKKPMEKFKEWLSGAFEGIKDTPAGQEIPDDVFEAMNQIFIQKQMKPTPSNKRAARLIAAELGLPDAKPEDLVKLVNEERMKNAAALAELHKEHIGVQLPALDAEYTKLNTELFDPKTTPIRLRQVRARMREIDDIRRPIKIDMVGDINDVPLSELENVIKATTKDLKASRFQEELNQAFDVWKTRRDFSAYPPDVLENVDTLKKYLRQQIDERPGALADAAEMKLYLVEQFQRDFADTISKFDDQLKILDGQISLSPSAIDWEENLFPTIHEFQMNDGVRTAFRNMSYSDNNYVAATRAVDELEAWLTSGKHEIPVLSSESAKQLKDWATVGSQAKADLVGTVLNGGMVGNRNVQGAISLVNYRMLDYNTFSRADQFMKNIFPFWMFPSRSVPFWVQTIATHPQLIALYSKIKRLSEAQRFQSGAVTSKGAALPSLDGYVKLPGTDMWFNPLAPLSWRYVLSITEAFDDAYYSMLNDDDNVPISAWLAQKFMETSPVFGFSVAPWVAFGIQKAAGLSDNSIPQFPIIPEISLIPRWFIPDQIRMGDSMYSKLANTVYPEASFTDYLVERRILQDALQAIQDPNSTPEQQTRALNDARTAIYDKGENQLWQSTYRTLGNENSVRSAASFFTGFYPKEFTDSMADLLSLRNEINLLKSSLNNQFQSAIFDIPLNDDIAWQKYLETNNTNAGQLYRLYTDTGWVKNDSGLLVQDPAERVKYLRLQLDDEQRQKDYYEQLSRLQGDLNNSLLAVPVGAPFEVYGPIFDKYFSAKDALTTDPRYQFSGNVSYLTNKPMSIIERETRYEWFKTLNSTRPTFNPEKETFEQWNTRVSQWEQMLPKIAIKLMPQFQRRYDINGLYSNLRPDQKDNQTKGYWDSLVQMSNVIGMQQWRTETDSVMDALNNAWKDLYWDKYWKGPGAILTDPNSLQDRYMERFLADTDFAQNNPPPSPQELYSWIQANYGDRFTYDEVYKWATYGDKDILNVQQRQLEQHGQEYMDRREVYQLLSWTGPYKKSEILNVMNLELKKLGEEDNILVRWMQDGDVLYSNDPAKIRSLIDHIKTVYAKLRVTPPTREQIAEYADAEDANNKFKAMVEQKFGMEYDRIIAIQADYYDHYDVSKKSKNIWISENKDAYKVLRQYWDARKAYARVDKLWGKYWLWATVPDELQGIAEEVKGLPKVKTQTTYKVTVTFPAGMEDRIGKSAGDAIRAAYNGTPLSDYDISYLRDFASRHAKDHPEWGAWLDRIIKP